MHYCRKDLNVAQGYDREYLERGCELTAPAAYVSDEAAGFSADRG